MKVVHSIWTGPGSDVKAGWTTLKQGLISWVLSSELAYQHYGRTELVTDSRGIEVLIKALDLPHTSDLHAPQDELDR